MSDFQDNEVRRVATDIVDSTTSALTRSIIERLGIESVYEEKNEDGTFTQLPVEFERAYKLLRESGQTINHEFLLEEGKVVLRIRFFKIDATIDYDVTSKYEFSIEKR